MTCSIIGIREFVHDCDLSVLESMIWFPEIGIGYYPVTSDDSIYDDKYHANFVGYKDTVMGIKINNFRRSLVREYWGGQVLDIGIGSGHFIESLDNSYGYDINPVAVDWLKANNKWKSPYQPISFDCMTFWDSLEHIKDVWGLIEKVKHYIFVSVPIVYDANQAMRSKHFKPREHCWYFTQSGIVECFAQLGFVCIEQSDFETKCGREDIMSFVFKRQAS